MTPRALALKASVPQFERELGCVLARRRAVGSARSPTMVVVDWITSESHIEDGQQATLS